MEEGRSRRFSEGSVLLWCVGLRGLGTCTYTSFPGALLKKTGGGGNIRKKSCQLLAPESGGTNQITKLCEHVIIL